MYQSADDSFTLIQKTNSEDPFVTTTDAQDESNQLDIYAPSRHRMLTQDLLGRDITNRDVLHAMEKVPRHLFVPENHRSRAYADQALPIGFNQTISQPYIVAFMTQACEPNRDDIALEIGTGSGYQAAVLAEIVAEVYTIEIVEGLYNRTTTLLRDLGYDTIHAILGDGYQGWIAHAPYDIILVTAAPESVPPRLIEQLAEGGRMIIPVGGVNQFQGLYRIIRHKTAIPEDQQNNQQIHAQLFNGSIDPTIQVDFLLPVAFVPMVH